MFYVSTRRGKQFNSMVQRAVDPLTGASRDSILISREDADRLDIADGGSIRLLSNVGSYSGRARIDQIKPGNLEVHWPEGNCLLSREEMDIASREPDYNAIVKVERVPNDNAR
jgi:anaerobic selenocysteine-containing dehydrogenase